MSTPRSIGTLQRDGFTLSHSIEGTGLPTLVIGSHVYYPRTFSAALREHLQLVFADHRGFGRCRRPFTTDDFELPVLVADVEALREQLGLPKVLVVGHSGHGHLALAYAKAHPDRVLGVVVLAMSPDSSPGSQAAAGRYLEESADPERKRLLEASMQALPQAIERAPDRRFIAYCLASGPRIWFHPTFDAAPLWEGVEVIPEVFDHVWGRILPTIDPRADAERITMPFFLPGSLRLLEPSAPVGAAAVVVPHAADPRVRTQRPHPAARAARALRRRAARVADPARARSGRRPRVARHGRPPPGSSRSDLGRPAPVRLSIGDRDRPMGRSRSARG